MSGLFSMLRNSALIRKVALHLLIVGGLILILITASAQLLLMPKLRANAQHQAEAVMSSIAAQIDGQIEQYISYSRSIIRTDDIRADLERYKSEPSDKNYQLLSLRLTSSIASSPSIRGIQLEAEDGTVFRSVINLRETDFMQLEKNWYQSVKYDQQSVAFSPVYDPGLLTPSDSIACTRTYYIGSSRFLLTLFLSCSGLTSVLDTAAVSLDGIQISDFSGAVVYQSGYLSDDCNPFSLNFQTADGGFCATASLQAAHWNLMGYLSSGSLMAEYQSIFISTLALCIVFCLLTILIIIPTTSHAIAPINSLSKTMQRISEGETDLAANIQSKDEIGDMSRVFNQMLVSLDRHMKQQIAFEANEQRMRYNLLMAQIDSHFIGNTMSTINSLVRQGRTNDVVALNTALLKIIQNNLRIRDLDITDTVAQEMEIVDQYWLIMKIRHENHAVLEWDVADEVVEECIPKNIIQPLVENCLFHGLWNEDTSEINGMIRITMKDVGDAILIKVVDNGKGIPPERVTELNETDAALNYLRERGRHIGISNIKQRLQYLYKQDCLHIACDHGTTVTMMIPKETPQV